MAQSRSKRSRIPMYSIREEGCPCVGSDLGLSFPGKHLSWRFNLRQDFPWEGRTSNPRREQVVYGGSQNGFKLFTYFLCMHISFSPNIDKYCWNKTIWKHSHDRSNMSMCVFARVGGAGGSFHFPSVVIFLFHWNVECTLKQSSSRREIFKINKRENSPSSFLGKK